MTRRPPSSTPFPYPTLFRSDLLRNVLGIARVVDVPANQAVHPRAVGINELFASPPFSRRYTDRKSTRLNSSHRTISYAVFCLKKKTQAARLRVVRFLIRESL